MGVNAHATHLHLPDKEQARMVAGALMKSPHSLIIAKPYGDWLNVYLEPGLSYKDVPEFPTVPYIELNCYGEEGLDLRLYHQDRLAFLFESGCGEEEGELEDELLGIAADLWKNDPNKPMPAEPPAQPEAVEGEEEAEAAEKAKSREPDFWDLSKEQQEPYLHQARESEKFKSARDSVDSDVDLPDKNPFRPFIPDDRTDDDFKNLLMATHNRGHGTPQNAAVAASVEKWMGGKSHSSDTADYIRAWQNYFGVRGSLWSLESIQEEHGDEMKGRIVDIDALDSAPKSS